MKKYLNYMLMAAMVGSLSWCVTACSDDDDKKGGDEWTEEAINLSVDQDYVKYGIVTDVHSAIVPVHVTCNGRWGAWIRGNEEDNDWLRIDGNKVDYSGNQTLQLVFDENHSGYDRKAVLRIVTDNGEMIDIKITQENTIDVNSSAQWFGNMGLGHGLSYSYIFEGDSASYANMTFSPSNMMTPDPLFCWAKIEELQQKIGSDGKPILAAEAYVENMLESVDYEDLMMDSLVHSKDTISVSFELRIGFGFFQMEGSGKYEASEVKGAAKANYHISRAATCYDAYISPAELVITADRIGGEAKVTPEELDKQEAEITKLMESYQAQNYKKYNSAIWKKKATEEQKSGEYLEPWQEEKLQEMYENMGMPDYGGIFSKSFARLYFNLNRAIQQSKTDPSKETRVKQLLNQLDANYGPVFISRGWFGGSLNMSILADTTYLITKGTFEGGMAADIMDGCVSFEGKVKYSEEATRLVRNSKAVYGIYGGNAIDCVNALAAHFASESMTDRDHLLEILTKWGDSLKETEDEDGKKVPSKAALQQVKLEGIWTLFDDPDVFQAVSDYMYEKHPTLKKHVGQIHADDYFKKKTLKARKKR